MRFFLFFVGLLAQPPSAAAFRRRGGADQHRGLRGRSRSNLAKRLSSFAPLLV